MTTFSQSEIIKAACTLAISTFPSTTSPIIIKNEVTKVLAEALKIPTKSEIKRLTGWRSRTTLHTSSRTIFKAIRKTPLPYSLRKSMTFPAKESNKYVKQSHPLISDISQVHVYSSAITTFDDIDSTFPHAHPQILAFLQTPNNSAPTSFPNLLPPSTPTTHNLHPTSSQVSPDPTNVNVPRSLMQNHRPLDHESSNISITRIQQSIIDQLIRFTVSKEQTTYKSESMSLRSLMALQDPLQILTRSLFFQSRTNLSDMLPRIAQVILGRSYTQLIK
jgi:hypothetical protein